MKHWQTTRFLALLRGINVGGNHIIKMNDLKNAFEGMGFTDVVTYIQSGNVIFSADGEKTSLTAAIEKHLSQKFHYEASMALLTAGEMEAVIAHIPKGFGNDPEEYRYDVWFVKPPLTVGQLMPQVRIKEGVDTVERGENVLYTSRLIAQAGKSYLIKVIQQPAYRYITIRNWNTTRKLNEIMNYQK
ncbi:hypothetical protein EZS27_011595 [termite gut metagenome]|uniref:DUF1697 domain-containing protein n=1 Tax=termite gut metagenome TaxID=433724 RepID=A0A5J4S5C0_9ZZZZ